MEGALCIVIAAFNEASGLDVLLPELPASVDGLDVHPIVVSDGSSDDTAEVARRHGVEVVRFAENRGKGVAVRAGIEHARGRGFEILVTMDGDRQHAVDHLPGLVYPIVAGEADVVFGSRYLADPNRHGVPLNRYLVRRATVGILKRLLSRTYTDPYCGYRAFSRDAIDLIEFEGDRYELELEAIFDARRHGLRTIEVPVPRIYCPGTSKMGVRGGRLLGRILVVWSYARTILHRARRRHIPARTPYSGLRAR
jgi:glycosyltransferase involved in cell wall biosynthesis